MGRALQSTLSLLDRRAPAAPPRRSREGAPTSARLLHDLEFAARRGELSLVYQPQVDRGGETVVGVEALVRWNHPVRGQISPALFIPLAERRGLISQITPWVMARAMTETRDLAPLMISVNASALEFNDPAFAGRVAGLIAEHGFDPRRLEVEITETAILNGESQVRRGIERAARHGRQDRAGRFRRRLFQPEPLAPVSPSTS